MSQIKSPKYSCSTHCDNNNVNKSSYTNHSNKKNPKHEEPLDTWHKIGTHYHTLPAVEIIQIKRERQKAKKDMGEGWAFQ